MSANGQAARPRVLFVGRTRYSLPLPEWLGRKFDALARQLDYRVVASAPSRNGPLEDDRFRLIPPARPRLADGVLFYLRCPFAVRREILSFRPEAIVAESPYTGAAALIARSLVRGERPRVVVEVHGDWRTATRLYGSPRRGVLTPLADWLSRVVVRRGDAVRALSSYTESLVEEVRGMPVTASFPTYTDLTAFTANPVCPLPERPTAIFVGMLEAYKNVDGLADAWREVVRRLPEARLVLIGKGARRAVVDALAAELPDHVEHYPELLPEEVAAKLDDASVLVLPSRSEGLGRVVIEAFARGRGVIGSRVGGIPDLVRDNVEGRLVEPDDTEGLADTLVQVLSDRALAERYGAAAHARYALWHTTPPEYAARMRELVDACLTDAGARPGEKPRVLIVSQERREAGETLRALRDELDYLIVARAAPGERPLRPTVGPGAVVLLRRFPQPLDWIAFYGTLPFRLRGLVRRFRPGVVIAESPYLGFVVLLALAFRRRGRPALVVETHGDWRAETRLTGSRARVLLAPLADFAARYALRRADALRAVSPFTAGLAGRAAGVAPVESFPTYTDLTAFSAHPVRPFPERPCVLFVGMLERSKDINALVEAWPRVAARVPEARLVVVGRGALTDLVERLRDDDPDRVEHVPELPPSGVAERMDASTCLVLPSRSEGLGRVILESFARGRPVVATRVGGIPDIVDDGVTGLLVESGDVEALAGALAHLLADRPLAERMGRAAREASAQQRWSADDYATRVRSLVDRTLARSTS